MSVIFSSQSHTQTRILLATTLLGILGASLCTPLSWAQTQPTEAPVAENTVPNAPQSNTETDGAKISAEPTPSNTAASTSTAASASTSKSNEHSSKEPAAPAPNAEPASNLPAGAMEYNKGVELFQIAQVQSEKGNTTGQKTLLRQAITHFETALKQNPKLVEAQSNIGFAYLTLHDNRKAISAFEKALLINNKHLNTLNGLSTAYAFNDNIDKAIQTFNQLTTLDPGNSQYFFNKGSVLQKAGRIEDARQAYEQALKIQPSDQRSLFNLGTLYENQGKLTEARPYYEKAKGIEIGNTIGLEAIHRIEFIDNELKTNEKSGGAKSSEPTTNSTTPKSQ